MALPELVIRFVIGGVIVSAFSVLGDLLRPKSFAGIFGAAPSVALATIGLTLASKGASYTSIQARSMMVGAVALAVYAWVVGRLLLARRGPTLVSASVGVALWLAVAFGLWAVALQ